MISGKDIMAKRDKYENPLVSRYASKEMSYIWSPEKKFTTWRSLWVYLAEGEKELGLDITEEQIAELKKFQNITMLRLRARSRLAGWLVNRTILKN